MRPLPLPKALPLLAVLLAAGTELPSCALAQGIVGTLTDLPDTGSGDLWQVSYQVSGTSFATGEGFTLYFPSGNYSELNLKSGPAGWDILTIQPVRGLGLPGLLDALALTDGPSIGTPFVAEFLKLSSGVPSSQAFETYSLNGNFRVTGSGVATLVIPETETWSQMSALLGLLFLGRRHLKRRRSGNPLQTWATPLAPNQPR